MSYLLGVAAQLKLLIKLIHEHNASAGETDCRRPQRLATILTILDDIRNRVHEKSQSLMPKRKAELRRCATDLHRNNNIPSDPKEKKLFIGSDDSQDLQRQLTARKGLEKMFYSLGKEKELIATELSRRVHELTCMEEMVGDLRKQNEKLLEKVRVCAAEHKGENFTINKEGSGSAEGGDVHAAAVQAMQERNGELTEQLLKTVEGYRSAKRRLKELVEERDRNNGRIADVATEAAGGVERLRRLRERVGGGGEGGVGEELCLLERVFAGIYRRLMMSVSVTAALRSSPRDSPARGSPRDSPLRDARNE